MNAGDRFVKHIQKECKKHGVILELNRRRYVVTDNTKCNGFFSEEDQRLVVAWGQPEEKRLRVLAHEYGHMTQWLDKSPLLPRATEKCYDLEQVLEMWVDHTIELSDEQLADYIKRVRAVELDCERRTVRLVKRFNLPIDPKRYVKTANAYIWFWTYMGMRRRWYEIGKEPYNLEEIVGWMPTTFCKSYDKMPGLVEQVYSEALGF